MSNGFLITIDFKDDADYTYAALESALSQATFIILDGYFKSKNNMLASAFFLEKYKDFIEWSLITPSLSGGELLIRANKKAKKLNRNTKDCRQTKDSGSGKEFTYKELESFYDENYYLNDCGGYESFKTHNAFLDGRLYIVQCLADVQVGERVLDIGCGRGELSYAMAKSGADVLGIDYSDKAIEIAKKNFQGRLANLNYQKMDFFKLDKGILFDKIVASDLVEHIDAELLEKFMENIANRLSKDGKFILHTYPNKYIYSYKYKRDRLKAKEIGLYLPENPRSFYESLMHINEQKPSGLKKLLKKYFKNYCVWTSNIEDPLGNLIKKPLKSDLINQKSIFAIASNGDINRQKIINLLMQNELNDISGIALELLPDYNYPKKIKKNTVNSFKLKLINNSDSTLKSLGKTPVNLSYHIKDANGNYVVYDGIRTRLPSVIYPRELFEVDYYVQAPEISIGIAVIEFTMVQEDAFWFENKKDGFIQTLSVEII